MSNRKVPKDFWANQSLVITDRKVLSDIRFELLVPIQSIGALSQILQNGNLSEEEKHNVLERIQSYTEFLESLFEALSAYLQETNQQSNNRQNEP